MQIYKFLSVLITIGVFAVPCLLAAPNVPNDVQQAAQAGLAPFLNQISSDALEQYGFRSGDDLQKATLAAPFLLHTITPAALDQYREGLAVASLISPTTSWYFPVLIAGQARAILVVDRQDNQWQAVSLGYAVLAQKLAVLNRQWKAADGYHPILIAVYQAQQYLFTVPEKDAYNLTKLSTLKAPSAGAALATPAVELDYSTLDTVAATVGELKPTVQNAIKSSK